MSETDTIKELEMKIKLQTIQLKAQNNILSEIRSILSIPPGYSILNFLKPTEITTREYNKPPRKTYNKKYREELKGILNDLQVSFKQKDSTRYLFSKLINLTKEDVLPYGDLIIRVDELIYKMNSNL